MFQRKDYKEKQLRYSIRKVSFGAASVAISALYLLMGSAAVSASEVQAVNGDQTTVTNPATKDNEDKSRIEKNETTTEVASSTVVSLDKTSLTKLIEEIDGKFAKGTYDSKTEDSVNQLKAALEAAKTALSTAKTQAELTQAHANLIVATTKLQTKPEDKKQASAVDTTNGKATVGIKATNTEKAADTNSIANSGSRDERNGKALDANNPFRTGTDAATTDTDPAANQTYNAPAENADLGEITRELLKLPDAVQNNTKIQDMNDLGDKTGVARGDVKEIQEFGGWKAINQPDGTAGKFAIARKTEAGVFPVETVNTVFTNIRNGQARYYDTYVGEQAFDRSKDYMLFLGKVRTIASENEQTFNGKPYSRTGLGGSDSYAIKSFSGIEKTFKAHSPETGSKVKVAFKTGFTGDLNGTKAKYLVEVVYRQNDSEVTAYTYTFEPQPRATVKNDKGIVTPAKDGTGRAYIRSEFNNYTLNKAEVEEKMAEAAYKPNGQAGTFTSSDIDLPVGVTEYTVRIKVADTDRMGMGYQSPLRHYALPVTGLDFSIEQDTRKLAKNLLQRVYDKLKATEERDIKGKTEGTISAYKAQLERVKNLLEGELNPTQTYKDIVNAVLDGQKALRTDKTKLDTSNNKLLDLINETPDPRIGKTPISKEPYNTAKDEAIKAREEAQKILNQDNPDPDVVAAAVSKLNEKLAELKAARAELVVAATDAQKTKLEADAAKLVKADTDGKTQDSINAYNREYDQLTTELEAAKAKAAAIKTDGDNASRLDALAAQEAVDGVLAKLDAAKAMLVDKATEEQVAELRKAEAALTPAEESSLVGTKTPASIAEYKKAVDAIQSQLTEAKAKAADLVTKAGQDNAKKAEAAEAIAKVDALKAKLADATALLKDKANTGDLATAKEELKALAKAENVTEGKTTSTTEAYEAAKRDADAAVTAAEGIINNADSTPEQVAEALTNVRAKKAELEKAKAALVDKATEAQKTKLEESAAKLVKASTDGKTQESINEYETTYNNLKTELDKAIEAAEAIKTAGDNASEHAALKAQEAVDAVLAKLEAAKAILVDKATEEQKAELAKAEAALTPAEESSLAGTKTPASIAAYKNAVDAIQSQLSEAKAKAAALVTKAEQNNAKKVDAAEVIAKVDALKVELAKANALLKDKANTNDLAAAKDALKELAKAENVTDGKTTSTATGYADAKLAADAAVAKAEGIINNADSTPEQVAEALTEVNAKKAELEKAKAALLDKITQDQKDDLANAEENLKLADTTGKAKESVKAYNDEVAKLSDELAAAKQVAKDLLDKGDNAGELEAYRVQAKINKLKSKLAEAAKLLKEIDKSAAKKEVEEAAKNATDAIVANNDLTSEQKEAAKAKVAEEATKAIGEIDKATTEDDVIAAKNAGKFAIEKEAAKAEVEAAKAAKEKLIDANDKLSNDEKQAAKDAVEEAATNAIQAIDAAQDQSTVDSAKTTGKEAVEAVNPVGKEKALAAIDKALAEKEKAIDANDKLSDAEKEAAKAEAKKAADEAKKAINEATDQAAVDAKQTEGTSAVEAVNPVGKEKALDAIQKATEDKLAEIDRDDKLSDKEKDKAKAEVAKAAIDAVNAINEATNQAAVDAKQTEGTKAVSEVNPVGKDKAKAEIEKELAEKTKAIDTNTDLTPEQKADAKAKIAEEAKKAIDAINKATTTEEVASAKESGKLAIEKEAAKAEIEAAKAAKEKAIDANPDLTDEEKAEAKARVEEEAEAAKNAIDKATELSDIDKVTETGKEDIKKVTVTSAKEEAKKAIDKALEEKEKAIDERTDLTQEEKEEAKKAAREEAEAAKNAIDKATTLEDINKVLEDGKENIAKINPETLKDRAKKAIDEALAAKEKAIDARTDLTQEEKEAAKKAAREEAEAAKNAIDKATTSEDINKVLEDGKENIAKINPENLKDKAKKAIDEALAEKEKAIDARTDLLPEEKEAAKKAAREEAEAAKNAIDKATTLEDINKVLEDGKENIAKINPVGSKEDSKKSIEERLTDKENHQQNNTQEKVQEDSKSAAAPSNNSEQPAVNQTEDVKENPSTTSQETKGSKQTVLPNTGTGNEISIFGSAAMTVLASLGLVATSKKKEEE